MNKLLQLTVFLFFLTTTTVFGKDVIIIKNEDVPKGEKEAILILNGLGESAKGTRHQKKFFGQFEYDVYIPDYIDENSIDNTRDNAANFFEAQKLSEYKGIHIVSFILGAWSINPYIQKHGEMNIKTIVYDRSPLQELAPQVVDSEIPGIGRMVVGKILRQFKTVPYPAIENGNINIGLIVESKATPLMRIFKKETKKHGPFHWEDPKLNQDYDDRIYTHLNHKEMYISFDEIGDEMMHFIRHGKFPDDARRTHYDWDPFVKYKKEKRKN